MMDMIELDGAGGGQPLDTAFSLSRCVGTSLWLRSWWRRTILSGSIRRLADVLRAGVSQVAA